MEKKENNILWLILLVLGVILLVKCQSGISKPPSGEGAYVVATKHLQKEYNEEFVIQLYPGRHDGYNGTIYPKRYIGTPREKDEYYREEIFVSGPIVRDRYGLVIRNEGRNKFFKPKLEELFGKNVLPILDGNLGGTIYIFGSIKDKNGIIKYQKGIFDFVQYLKATDNYERVLLTFVVIDERVLEDDFEDLGIKYKLMEAKGNSKTEKEFLVKRENIMNQIKITDRDKSERIESINKGKLSEGSRNYFGYNSLVRATIISPKMMKEWSLEERYASEVGKTYDKIEEIHMENTEENFF